MKQLTANSAILITLSAFFWLVDSASASASSSSPEPRFHVSLQQPIGFIRESRQIGVFYPMDLQWSFGAYASSSSKQRDSVYGVDSVSGFGGGISAKYYKQSYAVNGILGKGRLGLQKKVLSQTGYTVDGSDQLKMIQMDADFLGGYQFVWSGHVVLDLAVGVRKSFLDVAHKEYVFVDKKYNVKVFRAEDIESIHPLIELGLGFLL